MLFSSYLFGLSQLLFNPVQVGRVPLRKQIDYFEQSKDYMRTMMGESGVMKLLKGAIFSLTIGSNDFFDYLEPSIPLIGQSKLSHTILQDAMVSNLTLQLKVRNPYWLLIHNKFAVTVPC